MTAVEKIKVAAAKLNADEQYTLFRWWIESDEFKQRQLAALKREISAGVEDLENGRYYQVSSDSDALQLAEDIGRRGRERLAKAHKNAKG
jgi:hypothetical protein